MENNKVSRFEKEFRETPQCIPPSVSMSAPNKEIPIFNGKYNLQQNDNELIVDGSIIFKWLPAQGSFFTGEIVKGSSISLQIDAPIKLIIDGLPFGDAYITRRSIGRKNSINGKCSVAYNGDISVSVSHIKFSIPNFNWHTLENIRSGNPPKTVKFYNGRIILNNEKYKIIIDKSVNANNLLDALKTKGGFIISFGGSITKIKGAFSYSELSDLYECISNFLTFLIGRRTSIYFQKGYHEGKEIWADFTNYYCSQYHPVVSWGNVVHVQNLNQVWTNFTQLWKVETSKDFLYTVIHWYTSANDTTHVENSVILAQTALELIYNWLIVETNKFLKGPDVANISASNKIRLIISQLNISAEIPDSFHELKKEAKNMDGPEVFSNIRNCLVHGSEGKRKDLKDFSIQSRFQALNLALWYIELSILSILKYDGYYRNRTSPNISLGKGELVPWAKTK